MCTNEEHTDLGGHFEMEEFDFLRVPRVVLSNKAMKRWFSINKPCHSALQALRFRLICIRYHLIKLGAVLPKKVFNGSTFGLSLTFAEYNALFSQEYDHKSCSMLLGEIIYLICELSDVKNIPPSEWLTFLALQLFSTAYSLDDEKVYWYMAVSETRKDVDYLLPKIQTSNSDEKSWVMQVETLKSEEGSADNIDTSKLQRSGNGLGLGFGLRSEFAFGSSESSRYLASSSNHSLNPTNGTLDFVIISIMELLLNPELSDISRIFKIHECDPGIFSVWRLPMGKNNLNRCSQIWSGQHIAYRCVTCGSSTSSCICVECFQGGNHEGHEYYIYKSDYGGCCDCGDEQAWNKEGFCEKHCGGNPDSDTDGSDPSHIPQLITLKDHLRGIFHGILCHVICLSRLYCTAPTSREIYLPFHSGLASKIAEQSRADQGNDYNISFVGRAPFGRTRTRTRRNARRRDGDRDTGTRTGAGTGSGAGSGAETRTGAETENRPVNPNNHFYFLSEEGVLDEDRIEAILGELRCLRSENALDNSPVEGIPIQASALQEEKEEKKNAEKSNNSNNNHHCDLESSTSSSLEIGSDSVITQIGMVNTSAQTMTCSTLNLESKPKSSVSSSGSCLSYSESSGSCLSSYKSSAKLFIDS